jgi:hypothetical protein
MKSNLIISIIIYILTISFMCKADSTFVLNTIEIRQNDGMKRYYYENNQLKSQNDFYRIFVQSSNPNVMKNYLKYKKLNESVFLFSFGMTLLTVYLILPSKPEIDKKDLWYLPVGSACCISVGIPLSIVRHKYFKETIKEFNTRKP